MLEHKSNRKGLTVDGEKVVGRLAIRPDGTHWIGSWNESKTVWTDCKVQPESVTKLQ